MACTTSPTSDAFAQMTAAFHSGLRRVWAAVELRGAGDLSQDAACQELSASIEQFAAEVGALRAHVRREEASLEAAEAFLRVADAQAPPVRALCADVAAVLEEVAPLSPVSFELSQSPSPPTTDREGRLPARPLAGSPVTAQELAALPAFLTKSTSLQHVNLTLLEVRDFLLMKQALMSAAPRKLTRAKAALCLTFRHAETEATRGKMWFQLTDLRHFASVKADAKGKASVMALQHLRRLDAVSGGGAVKYSWRMQG